MSTITIDDLHKARVADEEAAFYQQELKEDSLLLAVETTEENEDKVMSILREANATLHQP